MKKVIFSMTILAAVVITSGCDRLKLASSNEVKELKAKLHLSKEKVAELQKENEELEEKLKSSLGKDKENIKKLFQ
ncbi:MAG TPA: hypothetical protein DCL21_02775 [Alphaproteobacteria bacterium]|nr:hypothetical protein [Alphaproteobacteria bacterium]